MDTLRKSLFLVTFVLALLTVALEIGCGYLLEPKPTPETVQEILKDSAFQSLNSSGSLKDEVGASTRERPPGQGISALAFLDGMILFATSLIAASFLLGDALHGRVQGVVSLIVGVILLVVAFLQIFQVLAKCFLMIGLFCAAPFGTIAYLATWGFFPKHAALTALTLLLGIKLAFIFCLFFSHPRFIQNKGLMFLYATSLLAHWLLSLLLGIVPIVLVSITDAIGALIALILALVWALFLIVSAVISIVKAVG